MMANFDIFSEHINIVIVLCVMYRMARLVLCSCYLYLAGVVVTFTQMIRNRTPLSPSAV